MKLASLNIQSHLRNGATFRGVAVRTAILASIFGASFVAVPVVKAALPEAPKEYRLEPGDQIDVIVAGQKELTGELMLDESGNIIMPLLGSVGLRGMTAGEIQQRITQLLTGDYLKQPSVTVRVTKKRPFYVLGDVRTPGSYPYLANSTIKSAVALAGGYGLSSHLQQTSDVDVISADERVRQLQQIELTMAVRLARLDAQRQSLSDFNVPAVLRSSFGTTARSANEQDLLELVGMEKQAFDSQSTLIRRQRALFEKQRASVEGQARAIDVQLSSEAKRLGVIKQQISRHEELLRRGLVRQVAGYDLLRELSTKEGEMLRLQAERTRLDMMESEISMKIEDAEATNTQKVMTEIQDVRSRLRELSITLPTARAVRDYKFQLVGGSIGAEPNRTYTITRTRDGISSVFKADELMVLEPGDIVEVKTMFPDPTSRGNTDSGRQQISNPVRKSSNIIQ